MEYKIGDKVRLTRNLPHSDTPLVAGDTGVVIASMQPGVLGVMFDRYPERGMIRRHVDGGRRLVLEYCQHADQPPAKQLTLFESSSDRTYDS